MVALLRHGHYPLPQTRVILDGLRETGSSDALRAAIAQSQEQLATRARAMLEGSSSLHHYLHDRTRETRPCDDVQEIVLALE